MKEGKSTEEKILIGTGAIFIILTIASLLNIYLRLM